MRPLVETPLGPPLQEERRLPLLLRDQPDDVLVQPRRHDVRVDGRLESVFVRLEDARLDRRHTHSPDGAQPWNVIWYSHALQPCTMWVRRSTTAPSASSRNRSSAAHTSGNRSATARIAQLCSESRNVPASACHSAM